MLGISIRYEFNGDEAIWEATIARFIDAVNADPEIGGKFSYRVMKAREGKTRVHWGQWDVPETVQILQSREYFKEFAAVLKGFAGDTLSPVPLVGYAATDGL